MSSLQRLSAFLAQDPGNTELACEVFDLHFTAGSFSDARNVLDALPEEAKHHVGVRFRHARLALVVGDYAQAERTLTELAASGHARPAIAHDIAFAQLCQRDLDAAHASIETALDRHGETPALRILQARVALMRKDYEGAQAALTHALRLDPHEATAHGLRALAWLDAGDDAQAAHAADTCLAQHPDQHEALLAAGTTALWRGEAERSATHYARALERFPNSGRALSGMAQCRMLAGDLEGARALLERAVVAMPDHIGTWHALGWIQLLAGDLDLAEKSYTEALALDRNFSESHGGLAVVALLDERYVEGEECMKRALRLDPNGVSGRYARSLWLQHTGEHQAADAVFAELMRAGAMPGISDDDARVAAQRLRERATARRGAPR